MQALILAAGFGKRLRPLTLTCPKPLLKVGGVPLIERQIYNLKKANIVDIVINIAYLGEQIQQSLKDGSHLGVKIRYSLEDAHKPLETGGAIIQALQLGLLTSKNFMVVNSDILTNYNFAKLVNFKLKNNKLAHLVLVDNPAHNVKGDWALHNNLVVNDGASKLTYSGMGLFNDRLFAEYKAHPIKLATILTTAITAHTISGEHFKGLWLDVGTPHTLFKAEEMACIPA